LWRINGTGTAASGALGMLRAAKEVFFASRDPFDGQNDAEMEALFSAFEKGTAIPK